MIKYEKFGVYYWDVLDFFKLWNDCYRAAKLGNGADCR